MASTLPDEVATVVGPGFVWSADQVRELFLQDRIPPGIGGPNASILRKVVEAFWADIDTCYDDDWERKALPSEKRWICEGIVEQFAGRSD